MPGSRFFAFGFVTTHNCPCVTLELAIRAELWVVVMRGGDVANRPGTLGPNAVALPAGGEEISRRGRAGDDCWHQRGCATRNTRMPPCCSCLRAAGGRAAPRRQIICMPILFRPSLRQPAERPIDS
jgi:hypothetical protein